MHYKKRQLLEKLAAQPESWMLLPRIENGDALDLDERGYLTAKANTRKLVMARITDAGLDALHALYAHARSAAGGD